MPASIRLDPVAGKIIESRFKGVESTRPADEDLLKKNWVYDGEKVSLHGARGEYVSFQVVMTNHSDTTLEDIRVEMSSFKNNDAEIKVRPELFLEWSVNVLTPSTGYPLASLNKGCCRTRSRS